MRDIYINIETFCNADLKKSGVYRYASDPSFELMLFSFSVDGGTVKIIDLAQGQSIPDEIISVLKNNSVRKWAFNSQFERVCISEYLKRKRMIYSDYLNPQGWFCSSVMASYMGLPTSIKDVATFLHIAHQNTEESDELLNFFCSPCKPSKANNNCTRNMPKCYQVKWAALKCYNAQFLENEIEIFNKLSAYNITPSLWDEYHLDQQINDRGVRVDSDFVNSAINIDEKACSEIKAQMKILTGLDNPNSPTQMKQWLATQNITAQSLDKNSVANILHSAPPLAKNVLTLWQQLKKTSVEKYNTMNSVVCKDGRARGMFQFYGANRTGRWSGKLIQLQNLPQNHLKDLENARNIVASGDFNAVKSIYGNVRDTLSQLIRTSLIPDEGHSFIIADFSAIEPRILAWLAGETWRQQVFANNGDLYSASASKMFGVNVVKNGENSQLRAKGKVAELALGYGGNIDALKAMGALQLGIQESELSDIVTAWRNSNQNIVNLWLETDKAVRKAIQSHSTQKVRDILFIPQNDDFLFIQLPSERRLSYPLPKINETFNGFSYEGIDASSKRTRISSYGAKIVENIVQAIARDILAFALNNLKHLRIVMHIHDELIIETTQNVSVNYICDKMKHTPQWANGLKLDVEGFSSNFYKKG